MSNLRPIIELNRKASIWFEQEIYPRGQVCPNVDDMVWSWSRGPLRCIELNVDTGISVLEPFTMPRANADTVGNDLLLGNGGHSPSEYYLMYVDNSVSPATMTADAKLRMYRKDADHVKYFINYDQPNKQECVSKKYDGSGTYLNDRVELEAVQVGEPNVQTVVTPVRAHTTHTLAAGQFITAVVYNEQGGEISTTNLVVKETALFNRGLNSARYIESIHLRSPWMRSDSNILEVPVNLPVSSLGLTAEVVYHDGKRITHPVDGTRFSLYGLDNYVASVPDYNHPLVLSYRYDANEVSTNQSSTDSSHETKAYTIRTLPAKHEYNLKLYVYPHWDGGKWVLKYYLANLSRGNIVEVTNLVEFGVGGVSAFNPTLWGIEQTFTVSIRLDKVNSSFAPYRHVQSIKLVVMGEPTNASNAAWLVHYEDEGSKAYGNGVRAEQRLVSVTDYRFKIGSGSNSTDEFLQKCYRPIVPLHDNTAETSAPNPTHFDVVVGDVRKRFPISMWNQELAFAGASYTGATIPVIWIMETEHQDLYLGVSGFMVKVM